MRVKTNTDAYPAAFDGLGLVQLVNYVDCQGCGLLQSALRDRLMSAFPQQMRGCRVPMIRPIGDSGMHLVPGFRENIFDHQPEYARTELESSSL